MTNESLITELFLYFAKFVKREGVVNLFNKGMSNVDGYNELRNQCENPAQHSLLDIDNYVFGANLEAVALRISKIYSNYLFVDFGEINFDTDRHNRETDSWRMAVSVATRLREFESDLVEQALAFSNNLTLITTLRNQMKTDQRTHPWLKDIAMNHAIVPLANKQLMSVGWTLIFTREGYDSLNLKKQ